MLRLLSLALPSFAVAVLAYAFLLAGAERPVIAARVFAGPTPQGTTQISVQIQVFEEYRQTESALPHHPISVLLATIADDATPARWDGQTNAWGFAEAQFQLPSQPRETLAQITVQHRSPTSLSPTILAVGSLPRHLPQWAKAQIESGVVPGLRHGPYAIEVAIQRGALAVPFPGFVEIRVSQLGKEAANVELKMSLVGAGFPPAASETLISQITLATDERGMARARLTPQSHAVELTVEAGGDETSQDSRWFGALPVVPGAMLAERSGSVLNIVSPIERSHAFVRFVSRRQRLGAQSLSLQADSNGTVSGTLSLPPRVEQLLARNEPVWAVVSSEPDSLSGGSVGWSLLAPGPLPSSTYSPSDSKVVDGLDSVQRVENERRHLIHQRGIVGAVAILLLFGLVFFARLRRQPLPPSF